MRDIVNPRQTVVVTCRGSADVLGRKKMIDSGLAVAWHSPLSFDPELYGICIGKTRFSLKLISESRVFAVNFMGFGQKETALVFGSTSGHAADKFAKSGASKVECDSIDCCRIGEAAAFLECEVIDEFDVGDHVFFVGKVLNKRQVNDDKRLFYKGGSSFTSTL